jgi:glycosyltransferase involved in cell wall biosynthesis
VNRPAAIRELVKILIISWFFPPMNHVASGRPYSWAGHFAQQNHSVTVLTPEKDPQVHGTLTMVLEPRKNLCLMETPLRLRRTSRGKAASWTIGTLPQMAAAARGQDVIISTYPYANAHTLGRVAKVAAPKALWCADYRDLWHDNYLWTEGKPFRRWLLRWIEQTLMRPAGLNITVSEPLAERLRRTHPHVPCTVVYNGFEGGDYHDPHPPERLASRAQAGAVFRILYTGTLYRHGYQDPEPLFAALARGSWRRPVKLAFYGPSAHETLLHRLRDQYGLGGVVDLPECPLSRADSLAAQRDADLLLHLGWTDPKNDGWLSGKVFEYMASGTPILSVGAGPDTALGRLLALTGTGCCLGKDVDGIVATLESMANQGQYPDWYQPRSDAVRGFSREAQAGRLLRTLEEARAGRWPAQGLTHSASGRNDLREPDDSGTSVAAKLT